ncbi:MAG: efflux RND transporter periplasmic adaptor subunit [Candidatus Eiseniibacteriota bacterium]
MDEPRSAAGRRDLSALRMNRETADPPARRRRIGPLLGWAAAFVVVAGAVVVLPRAVPWFAPKLETTTVQVVTPAQASTVLTATGYTVAQRRAAVAATIVARVVELRVDEGDPVKEGDVIAVLDSDDLRAAVRQAEAAVAEAKATLADAEREAARQVALFQRELTSEAQRDAAVTKRDVAAAKVSTADAALASARANLAYTVITSPLTGVVIDRPVEVGEMVAPGGFTSQQSTGALVRIADLSSLEVEADINESYIARVRPGQPAAIRVDAVPDVEYSGKLRQIVPTADRQRAVVQVKVSIDDLDERLVPDMSATVTFLEEAMSPGALRGEPKILVPAGAVADAGGTPWVWVVAGDRLRRTVIELEGTEGEMLAVRRGLAGGERIVRTMNESLQEGRRVRT